MSMRIIAILIVLLGATFPSLGHARPIGRRYTGVMSGGGGAATALATFDFPYWTDGVSVGNPPSSANWVEISGITHPTKAANANYIWMQSDGSIDLLFAVNKATAATAGELTVGTKNGVDYEDLSSARISGQSYIYLADIGNNAGGADSRGAGVDGIIYRIKEPTITGSNFTISDSDIETIQVVYPAGSLPSHRDAETLLVDPDTGKMYIITKREAVPGVYSLNHAASYSGIQTLVDEGNMFDIPDVSSASASGNAVGGNISPNGREILVKSYDVMYHFPRNKSTQTVMQALQATPLTVDGYVGGGNTTPAPSHPSAEPQGEAVTFDYSGENYYTMSEFVAAQGSTAARFPLFKYTRLTGIPSSISFQDGVLPNVGYVGTTDTYIWDTNPTTDNGTATSLISDKAVGVETDQRKILLKWDLTLIPYGATIVGARSDLFINTEGQGWAFYRILAPGTDWVESTTYDLMVTGINDDGVEASTTEDNRNGVNLNTIQTVTVRNNLLVNTPQAWVSGTQINYGYLNESTDIAGGDGQQFDSRQGTTASRHPKLTLRYLGGYTPEDESSLVRWWSGMYEAGETWLADAASQVSWPDRSSTNDDTTQGVAGMRPTYQTRESNVRGVVRFDGVDDIINFTELGLSDFTLIVVQSPSVYGGDTLGHHSGIQAFNNLTTTSTQLNGSVGSTTFSHSALAAYDIQMVTFDSSTFTVKHWVNGVESTISGTSGFGFLGMTVDQIGGPDVSMIGDIAEIAIFNSVLSTAAKNRVGQYFAWAHKKTWTSIT